MMFQRVFHLFSAAVILASVYAIPALASSEGILIPDDAIVISEILPNPSISPEKGTTDKHEFVELHNTSATEVDVSGFTLVRDDDPATAETNGQMVLSDLKLAPGEHRIINPNFTLLNSSSTIQLVYAEPSSYVHEVRYENMSDASDYSWQQINTAGDWGKTAPTPNKAPAIDAPETENPSNPDPNDPGEDPEVPPNEDDPNDPEPDPEPEPEETCDITDLHLSEIVSNPAGSDSAGKEFVELYNASDKEVSLEHCELTTSKPDEYEFEKTDVIAAKSYKTFTFYSGLLNGGGTVTLADKKLEKSVEYPELKDNEAYAHIKGSWQKSKKLTPGAENALPEITDKLPGGMGAGLKPCPPGKYRNPATNKCKNIESSSSSLTPCGPGKVRNPLTNRCKSAATTASTSLTPCKPGQTRNPETNRCKKADDDSSKLTPCKQGYERNPETNRCRKTEVLSASTSQAPPSSDQNNHGQSLALVAVAAACLGLFLLYEYRYTIGDKLSRIKWPWASKS